MLEGEELRVYASYRQFYIQDSDPLGASDDPEFWTEEAHRRLLAVGRGILAVGTGSYDFVRVRVERHASAPRAELAPWDHVTDAGLDIRTGLLLVFGCLSDQGLFFRVEPTHYRVRCSHANLVASTDSTGDAGDWYLVQFWPSPQTTLHVLKQWAGLD